MRYLSLSEILEIYKRVMQQSGGSNGIRDNGALDSAIAQPRMSFDGKDLYPTLVDKAVALCFSLVKNHPFTDGNKRIGHAAMFYGIIIRMYCSPNEHNPPHFHAYYQDTKAIIDINNCELKEGKLPPKQIKLTLAWAEIHKEELLADWELASKGELPFKIEPLK